MFWDKISSLYDLFENIYNKFMSVFFNLFMVRTMKKLIFFLPFVFCIKVPALELTHTLTHLWSDSSGTALLYRWNVVEDFYAERYEFSSGTSISLLDSTVDYCETSCVNGNFFADYKNRYFGLSGDFGFSFADSVSVSANHVYSQEGVSGINARISVPVYIEDAVINPYFNFFTAESKKGDFYWFYGKVENPYTGQYGVQLLYKNHEVNGSFCAGNACILSNEDSRMGDASYNLFSVLYRQTWYAGRAMFKPYSGCSFFFGDFNGALPTENKLYFLYPFKYYKVQGDIQAFAVLAGLFFEYRRNSFLFSLDCNSIFFANQNGSYDVNWRYKKNIFFDGSSGSDSGNIDFMNKTGLVSVNSKCVYDICLGKLNLNVFLSKIWLIPFCFSLGTCLGGTSEGSDGGISENLVFSWLFSGISAGLSINF